MIHLQFGRKGCWILDPNNHRKSEKQCINWKLQKTSYQKSWNFPWQILHPWKHPSLDELLRSNAWPEWMGENETSFRKSCTRKLRCSWGLRGSSVDYTNKFISNILFKQIYHTSYPFTDLFHFPWKTILLRFLDWTLPRLTSETSTWTAAQQGAEKDVPLGQCSPHPPFAAKWQNKSDVKTGRAVVFSMILNIHTGPYI